MKKILLILLSLITLTSCFSSNQKNYSIYKTTTTESGFDTEITFMADVTSEADFEHYFNILKTDFLRYHKLFDIYNNYEGINNLKTINDNAGVAPVKVDQVIIDMLLMAKKDYDLTNKKFDPTMGAVLKIWHQYREEGILLNSENKPGLVPSLADLQNAYSHSGWDKIEIDETNQTVYINDKQASLDVGGIAKGYATELVARTLESAGCKYAAISAGGNVRTINTKSNGSPWVIGIVEPSLTSLESIDAFQLSQSTSMVTSGDYQRFYQDADNNRLHHLIDPSTLFPATNFRSVTIFTNNSMLADYLSTILFLSDYQSGKQLINQWNSTYPDDKIGVYWIVDKTNPDYQNAEFIAIPNKPFKIAMTDDIKNMSKLFSDK